MSTTITIRLLKAFFQTFSPTSFFTGMFSVDEGSFYNSEFLEIDIEREDETMSIVIEHIAAGYRDNSADIYTNKRFKAPAFKEKTTLNAFDLFSRDAGENPFDDPKFQSKASMRAMKMLVKMANKIRRSVEYQAAQILQTGAFTYTDAAGNALFTINFSPKTSHFPNAALSWLNVASDPLSDIEAVAEQIKQDSGVRPNRVVMGGAAFRSFRDNAKVQGLLDNRRLDLGGLNMPDSMGQGQTYQGEFAAGNFSFDLYTYDAVHNSVTAPTTKVPYMDTNKVIVMSDMTRLQATYGGIPRFAQPNKRVLPYLPNISDSGKSANYTTFAYLNEDDTAISIAIAQRPLMLPVQIDGFGCLTAIF